MTNLDIPEEKQADCDAGRAKGSTMALEVRESIFVEERKE